MYGEARKQPPEAKNRSKRSRVRKFPGVVKAKLPVTPALVIGEMADPPLNAEEARVCP